MSKETLYIYASSRDCNSVEYTKDGKTVFQYDQDYLPYCGFCGGDDLDFEIDIATGQIIGWDAEKVRAGLAKKRQEMIDRGELEEEEIE